MNINKKKYDVIILLHCVSGLGDQYSGFISCYNTYEQLKNIGYSPLLVIINDNKYFSKFLPLDYIFNLSRFENNILYFNSLSEFNKVFQDYDQIKWPHASFRIYSNRYTDKIRTIYTSPYSNLHLFGDGSKDTSKLIFDYQFLNDDVLKIGEKFLNGRTKIKAIHFRVSDEHSTPSFTVNDLIDIKYKGFKPRILNFIEKNDEVLITSSSKSITEYYTKNYKNVYKHNFSNDIKFHHINLKSTSDDILIKHAQEIAAEMFVFSRCDKILSTSWTSTFLTYGVVHNIHYKDWHSKRKELFYR